MTTAYGYKLFEMDKNGLIYPLFIGKNNPVPVNEWLPAENIPTKGFAVRPGWHLGLVPDAPWLKGADGSYKGRWKTGKRVWALVEYNDEVNYQDEVDQLPKKCMQDRVPENGYYRFREVGNREWIITGCIKVVKILSEEERQNILISMGYDEELEFIPYRTRFEKRSAVRSVLA